MTGNTEIIDQLVSKEALNDLKELDTQLQSAYREMENLIKKVQELNVELSKGGKSYTELTAPIEKHVKVVQEYEKTVGDINKTLQQREKLIESVITAEKEETKATEKQEQVTKKLEQTTAQLLAVAERTAKGINISAYIKENEKGMKNYSHAINAVNSQMGAIQGLQEKLNEKFRDGAISEEQYNNAMSGLAQKQSEYEQTLTSLQQKYEKTGEAQREIFNPAGEAFGSLSPKIQEQTKLLVEMNVELNNIRNEQKELDKSYRDGGILLEEYARKTAQLNTLEAYRSSEVKSLSKELQLNAQIANTSAGSYDNLSAKYSLMKIEINALGEAEGQNAQRKRELEAEAKKLYDQMNELQKATGKAQLQVGDYTMINRELEGALNAVSPALGRTTAGIRTVTKAALAFIATPLGLTLAAITAALSTVTSWFNRTVEGQNAMSESTAALTQLSNEFLDVADDIGEALFKMFTDPKEAIRDLGKLIKERIINQLHSIINLHFGLMKIARGEWNEGTKEVADALLQAATGSKDTGDNMRRAQDIQKELNKLGMEQVRLEVEKSKARKEQNELRNTANNKEKSYSERLEANNKYIEITSQIEDKEVKLLERQLKLAEEKLELTHNNKEDIKQVADLEKKKYDAEAAAQQKLFTATRTNNRLQKEAMTLRNKDLKAQAELSALEYKKKADLNEKIYKDETLSYEERETALREYIDYEIAAIEKQAIEEVKQGELTKNQIKLIHEKALYEIQKLEIQYSEKRKELRKDEIEDYAKNMKKYIAERSETNSQAMNDELLLAGKIYSEMIKANIGNEKERERITRDYQKQRLAIIREYNQKEFDEGVALLQELLDSNLLSKDERDKIEKEIIKLRMKNAKEITDYEIQMNEYTIAEMTTAEEKFNKFMSDSRTKAVMGMWEQVLDIANQYYEQQLQEIDDLEARENEYYENKLKTIEENLEAGTISEEEAAAHKRIIEEEQLQKEKQYEAQRKQMQKKQAVWQKAESIVQATINTATAVTSALGVFPPPLGIALAAIVGALGAAQIAMIASQKVPEYKKGTESHPGGLAYVGDGGKAEMTVLPSGEIWKTPAKKTLVNLPAGTEILPDFKQAFENIASQPLMIYRKDEGVEETIVLYDNVQRGLLKNSNEKLDNIHRSLSAIRKNTMHSNNRKFVESWIKNY
jgi:hypothetical protein